MPEPRRFYRSRNDRIISGVCGGLAKYFEIDPTIVRVVFALLAIAEGIGILLYIILMIVVPEEGETQASTAVTGDRVKQLAQDIGTNTRTFVENIPKRTADGAHARNIIGILIIMVGLAALARQFFPLWWISWKLFWPGVIIILGIYFLSVKRK